ncbi:hypothetical protein [Actinoplanes utahensis]|uniref:Serpin domain-containing protein n=1 Tax=Actinoplanes utahensis TaxID=1869 RepID=A0A0A6USU5_ACTUT|nr:hypothetical protein [Actinoplanes utahensis]KHD77539.1 hypothetical protein MB27_10605 [Actinoplanes utahensis]GIF32708.1 hypothetical protein Aut01nite_56940 [Actinoplanes utahensis]
MNDWIAAVGRYAQRVHAVAGGEHHVASPLGAWLLPALTASATPDPDPGLTEALGVSPSQAADVAGTLLTAPHPLVAAATAVWHSGHVDRAALARWQAGLPSATAVEPLRGQDDLDRWARANTFGLIKRFPVSVPPRTALVMGSALATKVRWDTPFRPAPARALGPASPWASRLSTVLRTPRHGHDAYVATTAQAGDVIVHAAPATLPGAPGTLRVMSVAAAPGVEPGRVLAAAYAIGAAARTPLSALPLGETALWDAREEMSSGGDSCQAVLPCWSATSDHELAGPGLGFDAAARTLAPLTGGGGFQARQSATATFGRYGFEAAAVTGFAARGGAPAPRLVRSVELRFGHPYAVVAFTDAAPDSPWHGVPVFSAWVTEPEDLPESHRGGH